MYIRSFVGYMRKTWAMTCVYLCTSKRQSDLIVRIPELRQFSTASKHSFACARTWKHTDNCCISFWQALWPLPSNGPRHTDRSRNKGRQESWAGTSASAKATLHSSRTSSCLFSQTKSSYNLIEMKLEISGTQREDGGGE